MVSLVTAAAAFQASSSSGQRTALLAPACSSTCRAPKLAMLDAPVMAVGFVAIGVAAGIGAVVLGADESDEASSDDVRLADLQSRLMDARSSNALTYKEVDVDTAAVADDDEALQRQRLVRERAQSMLDGARAAIKEGLDEAVLNKDVEAAEEYLEMLQKLEPLPGGIQANGLKPDYKVWLDEKWLEKRRQ